MNGYAVPKGFRWRFGRAMLAMLAMLFVLTLVGKKLAFSDTAYGIGYLVVFFLTTLTDRTDFYLASPYRIDASDKPEGPATRGDGPLDAAG